MSHALLGRVLSDRLHRRTVEHGKIATNLQLEQHCDNAKRAGDMCFISRIPAFRQLLCLLWER